VSLFFAVAEKRGATAVLSCHDALVADAHMGRRMRIQWLHAT
jgi:predicted ABC-type transport system involved in lysophospholipase L1 biosynthesis ATPase subunit